MCKAMAREIAMATGKGGRWFEEEARRNGFGEVRAVIPCYFLATKEPLRYLWIRLAMNV